MQGRFLKVSGRMGNRPLAHAGRFLQAGKGMTLSTAAPIGKRFGKLALAWNRCQYSCRIGNKRCVGCYTGQSIPP